jgi:hypothetical protein
VKVGGVLVRSCVSEEIGEMPGGKRTKGSPEFIVLDEFQRRRSGPERMELTKLNLNESGVCSPRFRLFGTPDSERFLLFDTVDSERFLLSILLLDLPFMAQT